MSVNKEVLKKNRNTTKSLSIIQSREIRLFEFKFPALKKK